MPIGFGSPDDDLLFAQKIDPDIINLIANALNDHSFFAVDQPLPIALLERSEREDWATDWAKTVLEWLKPLSLTHILKDPYLSGSAWGFEPEYQADLPGALLLPFPDDVVLRIPKGKTVAVSFYERGHDVDEAPYAYNVANHISYWRLQSVTYTAPVDEDIEVTIPNGGEILFNSLVITGPGELVQGHLVLLYENLEATLINIFDQLRLTDPWVLTEFEIVQPFSIAIHETTPETWNEYAMRGYPTPVQFYSQEMLDPDSGLEFVNPVFTKVPEWYHFAHAQITGEEPETLGVPLVWRWFNETFWAELGYVGELAGGQNYRATISKQQASTYLAANTTGGALFVGLEALPYSVGIPGQTPNSPLAEPLTFFSVGDKLPRPEGNWGSSLITDRVLFDGVNRGTVRQVQDEETNEWKLELIEGDLEYQAGAQVIGGIPIRKAISLMEYSSVYSFGAPFYRLFGDWFTYSIHGFYPPNLVKNTTNWFCANVTKCTRRGQTAHWFQTRVKGTYYTDFDGDGNVTYFPVFEQEEYGGMSWGEPGVFTQNFGFVMKVEFWEEPPPYLPQFREEGETPTFPQFTEEEWNELLYPGIDIENEPYLLHPYEYDGEPYLLKPDLDNGDIMPDSKRIREIHAALEAERFGTHPTKPESPNVRSLGRLLEAASYILGVNIDADGYNVPYPDPMPLDPKKIGEINTGKRLRNAQFAIAEMDGKFDASSIYEVRSPVRNAEVGEVDQRPHAIKYHNLAQLMDAVADDQSKQLGGGKNSIFQVPNATGDGFQTYEGVFQGLADSLYMTSIHGKAINELQNQSIKTLWMLGQILKALGVPCHLEKIDGVSGVFDEDGNELPGKMVVPALDPKSPTLVGLAGIILVNLQRLVGQSIGFKTDEPTEANKISTVFVKASPKTINGADGGNVTFTISRFGEQAALDVKIYVNLIINSSLGKDAFVGEGWSTGQWSIELAEGATMADFSVEIPKQENLIEPETITVVLSGGDNYVLAKEDKNATVTIKPPTAKEEEDKGELTENDWLLKFDLPDPKPDFVPDTSYED